MALISSDISRECCSQRKGLAKYTKTAATHFHMAKGRNRFSVCSLAAANTKEVR